jgi:hypothetical protein
VLGYDGHTWLPPNQDPGAVVDVSQSEIAAPIMLGPVIGGAPALIGALSAPAATGIVTVSYSYFAGMGATPAIVAIDAGPFAAAGQGIVVIGTATDALTQLAIGIVNSALTEASNFTIDFTTRAGARAGSSLAMAFAGNVLSRIVASGQVPAGWTVNGVPMTLDQLNYLILQFRVFGNNDQPGQPGNNVAVDQNGNVVPTVSTPIDPSTTVAQASIDGGGAADGGDISSVVGAGCTVGSS